MILLDTNLLARMTDSAHTQCPASRRAVHRLLANRERLIIVPQNSYEFWAVATRKPGPPPVGQNGLGMTCEQASQWLNFFKRRFTLLPDRAELHDRWHALVKTLGIKGFRSHDARFVAAMQTYGISRLLTFNAGDFNGFPITIIDPASLCRPGPTIFTAASWECETRRNILRTHSTPYTSLSVRFKDAHQEFCV